MSWYGKTKPNTTKAHIHQSKEMYYNTKPHHTTPQPFYDPFSTTTQVSQCQKRTSGLYGARED